MSLGSTKKCLVVLLIFSCAFAHAQQNPIFGFRIRPIIPSELFNNSTEDIYRDKNKYTISPQPGYNFGMQLRKSVYKKISLETGINYCQRKYNLSLTDSNGKSYITSFRFLGYEIPVTALIYIQLDEHQFINNSFGLVADFFPGDVASSQDSFKQFTYRKYWVLPALTASTGYEFRSEKYGYFSAGISYHRMLTPMAYTKFIYIQPTSTQTFTEPLAGHYFSFDLGYYFPYRKSMRMPEYELQTE